MSNMSSVHKTHGNLAFPLDTPSSWFPLSASEENFRHCERFYQIAGVHRDLSVIFKNFSAGPEEWKSLKADVRGTKRAFGVLLRNKPDLVDVQALHGMAEYLSEHPQILDQNPKNKFNLAKAMHTASNDPVLSARADQSIDELEKDPVLQVKLRQVFDRTHADPMTFYSLVHLSWLWEGARQYLEGAEGQQ